MIALMPSPSRRHAPDSGFTLIELMITCLLLGVVLTVVGGILIQGLRVQDTIQTSTQAASSSQLATESLGRGVHNALRVNVTAPVAGVSLLRSVSRSDVSTDPAGTLVCRAWVVINGELRTRQSSSIIAAPTSAAAVSGWTLLATGVAPVSASTPIFTDVGSSTVDVQFTVDAPQSSPVLVDTRLTALDPDPNAGLVCF